MKKRFVTRGIVMTRGVDASIKNEELSHSDILPLLHRHFANEGDECKEDKALNEDAIKNESGRVFSVFNNVKGHKLYIITDGLHLANDPEYGKDYPHTTILFPDEY